MMILAVKASESADPPAQFIAGVFSRLKRVATPCEYRLPPFILLFCVARHAETSWQGWDVTPCTAGKSSLLLMELFAERCCGTDCSEVWWVERRGCSANHVGGQASRRGKAGW